MICQCLPCFVLQLFVENKCVFLKSTNCIGGFLVTNSRDKMIQSKHT